MERQDEKIRRPSWTVKDLLTWTVDLSGKKVNDLVGWEYGDRPSLCSSGSLRHLKHRPNLVRHPVKEILVLSKSL